MADASPRQKRLLIALFVVAALVAVVGFAVVWFLALA